MAKITGKKPSMLTNFQIDLIFSIKNHDKISMPAYLKATLCLNRFIIAGFSLTKIKNVDNLLSIFSITIFLLCM